MKITALTPADVDTLRRALRVAIRTDRTTLSYDHEHMPTGAADTLRAGIKAMEQLADGLSPSAPPLLPEDDETAFQRTVRDVDNLRRELDRVRREQPTNCPGCDYPLIEGPDPLAEGMAAGLAAAACDDRR